MIICNHFSNFCLILKGVPFRVHAGSLTFSVAIFTVCCVICLVVLIMRRYLSVFGRGELGGPTVSKYLTAGFFLFLWLLYILLSSLQAYDHIKF